MMSRLLRRPWAAGLFGLHNSLMNPLPVKDGSLVALDWVRSYFFLFPCSLFIRSRADVSFTQPPPWVQASPYGKAARFWDLARLSFPDARREWLNSGQYIQQTPSRELNVIEDPDQQMLCMDYLFYVGAVGVRYQCCVVLPTLTTPSYRKVNMTTTSPLHGDTSSPTCTGLSALRLSASCT